MADLERHREPAKYIVARVLEGLAQDPRTNVMDIHVRVTDDAVLIMGTIEGEKRHEAVIAVVRELTPPDMRVEDHLEIISYAQTRTAIRPVV